MSRGKGDVHPKTQDRLADVARMTTEGMTAVQIGERLGITARSVTRLRARAGLTDGVRRAPYTPEQLELFDRLLTEGWSYREIQDTYGANEGHLARHFPGRGWTPKQKVEVREARRLLASIPTLTGKPTHSSERFNGHRRAAKTPAVRRWIKTGHAAAAQHTG